MHYKYRPIYIMLKKEDTVFFLYRVKDLESNIKCAFLVPLLFPQNNYIY